jgi:hypothetical protein
MSKFDYVLAGVVHRPDTDWKQRFDVRYERRAGRRSRVAKCGFGRGQQHGRRVMHKRRLGAQGGLAVLVALAGSACAGSGNGTNADFPNEAGGGGDGGTTLDSSTLLPPQEAGGDPDSAFGSFEDSSAPVDDDTGSPIPPGVDSGGTGGGMDSGTGTGPGDTGVTSTGLSVLYQVEDSNPMSAYIGCELSITNSSSTAVAVSGLEARYYFTGKDTNGVDVTPQMTINWSHVSTSGANADLTVTSTVNALQSPVTNADTYVAFDFSSSHSMLAPGESAVFSWQMQGPDPATDIYAQTSDYSFNASLTSLTAWANVPLFQGGTVVWGTAP